MPRKSDEVAAALADKGDDAQRLEIVQRARRFKRSWIEMAEALVHVRATRAYERWGYEDLYAYCQQELQIKKSTVDKLTGSFMALRSHAPQVLGRDGVAQPIPSVDAVDYFAQAMRSTREEDETGGARAGHDDSARSPEVIEELRQAVFDDNQNVVALRRRFNPLLHPKPEGADRLDALEKTRAAARRLENLLESCEGLSAKRVGEVRAALEHLQEDLEALIPEARERSVA